MMVAALFYVGVGAAGGDCAKSQVIYLFCLGREGRGRAASRS
jgi:hypothetical protein